MFYRQLYSWLSILSKLTNSCLLIGVFRSSYIQLGLYPYFCYQFSILPFAFSIFLFMPFIGLLICIFMILFYLLCWLISWHCLVADLEYSVDLWLITGYCILSCYHSPSLAVFGAHVLNHQTIPPLIPQIATSNLLCFDFLR